MICRKNIFCPDEANAKNQNNKRDKNGYYANKNITHIFFLFNNKYKIATSFKRSKIITISNIFSNSNLEMPIKSIMNWVKIR